jgi:peptidyl-tRNA hydrolase
VFNKIPELTKKASPEDPLNVYLIVNKDLGMSIGKVGAQCGHAIQYLIEYYNAKTGSYLIDIDKSNIDIHNRMMGWKIDSRIGKIVLGADTKEFNKLEEEYDPIVVVDAGLTEIAPKSKTVICLYPMFKDERSKTLKRLQLLK